MIRIRNLFDALLILEMVAAIVITQACSFQVPSGSLPSAQQLASAAGSAEQPSRRPPCRPSRRIPLSRRLCGRLRKLP